MSTPQPEDAHIYAAVSQLARIRKDVLLSDVWQPPEIEAEDKKNASAA